MQGGAIEDVADAEFDEEVRAAQKSNSRTDQILYGGETGVCVNGWVWVGVRVCVCGVIVMGVCIYICVYICF